MRRHAFTVAMLVLAATATAGAQDRCTHETLTVRGTPVTVGYCVSGAPQRYASGAIGLTVASTYAAAGGTLSRTGTLRFISFEGPPRLIESVELQKLGLNGTLHLTLVLADGVVRVQSAMLTPGAITIK